MRAQLGGGRQRRRVVAALTAVVGAGAIVALPLGPSGRAAGAPAALTDAKATSATGVAEGATSEKAAPIGTASVELNSLGSAGHGEPFRVEVDWPQAPVRGDRVTVHVTRADRRATTAKLQVRSGDTWVTVVDESVTTRTFTFRDRPDHNRYKLRVVLSGEGRSRGYAAPQQPPLVRAVEYADGPVRPRPGGREVTLLFEGRRGHYVELASKKAGPASCNTTRLRGPAGVVHRQGSGLWRLPRTAGYRLELVPCWGFDLTYADLTRVRLVPLVMDAAPVTLHRRSGVTDVAVVDVPATGRVMVRGWDRSVAWSRITTPERFRLRWYGTSPTHLEAGLPLRDGDGNLDGTVTAGRYLFVPTNRRLKASLSTPVATTVTPEGPAATLGDQGVVGRERAFSFNGVAGSFVYPDPALSPTYLNGGDGVLVGPDGQVVSDWYHGQGWLLRADGTHTLYVTPGDAAADAGEPVTMRVRQAVSIPAMRYGVATRFTVAEPDRWVIAILDSPASQYHYLFKAAGSTMTGPWEAVVGGPTTDHCTLDPLGPLGCGDNNVWATVSDTVGETPYSPTALPNLVVLRPGAGVTGTVDLTVGPGPVS